MFEHMQSLPIMYFDRHTHGEIMSRYTNDTDTLRQMISQSIPQLTTSIIMMIMSGCYLCLELILFLHLLFYLLFA